jgi:hypothetical protein
MRIHMGRRAVQMEPKDLIVWGGAAAASYHPVVEKLLGPTADYLGETLKSVTQAGAERMGRVLRHAIRKLGDRINAPGVLSPRVVKELLIAAPFIQDELSAEYFGGVLAASRSDVPRDDRGAALLALLGRLSAYQVRTHCIVYSVFKALHGGLNQDVGEQDVRRYTGAFITSEEYARAVALEAGEDLGQIMDHSVVGLARESLVDGAMYACDIEAGKMARFIGLPAAGGLVVHPSSYGAELLLWACGRADIGADRFLDPLVSLEFEAAVDLPRAATKHTY